jgi:hypothetical protein
MAEGGSSFDRNVFINCPFDPEYDPLVRPLLFTILQFGFVPRIASERSDGGELRLAKITQLIRGCRYSIHDLSRLQARMEGEFYRLNMPFELGIDYGCRVFGGKALRQKRFLILGEQPFTAAAALSDIAGTDPKYHHGGPAELIREVRNWFVETVGVRRAPSAGVLWYKFTAFMRDFYKKCEAEGFAERDVEMMPVPEFIDFAREWVSRNLPPPPAPA